MTASWGSSGKCTMNKNLWWANFLMYGIDTFARYVSEGEGKILTNC